MNRPKSTDKKYEFPNGDFNDELFSDDRNSYIDYLESLTTQPEPEQADAEGIVNTIENALDFLLKTDPEAQEAVDNGYDITRRYNDEEWLLKMVSYTNSILSSRPAQPRIVLPSERIPIADNLIEATECKLWNAAIRSIKSLNEGAEFVEA